jgi:hypothetical protein
LLTRFDFDVRRWVFDHQPELASMIPVNAYATAPSDFTTENEQRPAQLSRFFVPGSSFFIDKEYHSASSAARAKIVNRNFVDAV